MGDLPRSLSPSSCSTSSTSSSSSLYLQWLPVDSELWLVAEQRTQEILYAIQPTFASEHKRKEVADYVQMLIQDHLATEVFPFGSVPFKTYLPDGDIDLTVLSHQSTEEDLAKDVCTILTSEHQDPVFQVKDFQYVQAQVKVVKCSVKDISFDISFNQTAGLYAVCFLEQVDRFIGKDHLFKRSIIFIKAWCFYESRILGAHHGLISTYALEILVLYIINRFHSALPGPLAVLHRFLDYYSTFDWEKYCITINGPIAISAGADVVENNANELLLSQEFLMNCIEMFPVSLKSLNEGSGFRLKHLNIVDPLQPSNNLGRSVNKGNSHRIRCALSYGAKMLQGIFKLPGEKLGSGIEMFFMNTLERNGKGQRPDAEVPVPAFGTGRSEAADLTGDYDCFGLLPHGQWYHKYTVPVPLQPSPPSSPTQFLQTSTLDAVSQMLHQNQNFSSRRGTDVFLPNACRSYISKPKSTVSGFEMKSHGTGPYIPDRNHQYNKYRGYASWNMAQNPDPHVNSPRLKSPRENCGNGDFLDSSPDQSTSEEDNKSINCSCPDFSPDDFPQLPCSKNCKPSTAHRSCQSTMDCSAVEHYSTDPGAIQFGSFGLASSRSPALNEGQMSATLATMIVVPELGMQKHPTKSDVKMACGEEYQLKNSEEDFPRVRVCISIIRRSSVIDVKLRGASVRKVV